MEIITNIDLSDQIWAMEQDESDIEPYDTVIDLLLSNIDKSYDDLLAMNLTTKQLEILTQAIEELHGDNSDTEINRDGKFSKVCGVGGCR